MKIKAEVSRIFENRNDMLKAATNIILEDGKDSLVIKNVRIIEGKNGLFMSLPARRNVKMSLRKFVIRFRLICVSVCQTRLSPHIRKL